MVVYWPVSSWRRLRAWGEPPIGLLPRRITPSMSNAMPNVLPKKKKKKINSVENSLSSTLRRMRSEVTSKGEGGEYSYGGCKSEWRRRWECRSGDWIEAFFDKKCRSCLIFRWSIGGHQSRWWTLENSLILYGGLWTPVFSLSSIDHFGQLSSFYGWVLLLIYPFWVCISSRILQYFSVKCKLVPKST